MNEQNERYQLDFLGFAWGLAFVLLWANLSHGQRPMIRPLIQAQVGRIVAGVGVAQEQAPTWLQSVVRVGRGGSGCLIHSEGETGYVITNQHVIGQQETATALWLDGHWSTGPVVWRHPSEDVAVFAVNPGHRPAIPLATRDQMPNAGDAVYVCGYGGRDGIPSGWNTTVRGYAGRAHVALNSSLIGGDSGGVILFNGSVIGVNQLTFGWGICAHKIVEELCRAGPIDGLAQM